MPGIAQRRIHMARKFPCLCEEFLIAPQRGKAEEAFWRQKCGGRVGLVEMAAGPRQQGFCVSGCEV